MTFWTAPKAAYNVVTVTTAEVKVISVTVSPNPAIVAQGGTQQFTATVTAIGGADETMNWSISGQTSMLTFIDPVGLFTAGYDETSTNIKVKVVSIFDASVFDVATVSISTVGIAKIKANKPALQIFPNPTKGKLTMDNGQLTINNVEIFDMMGRKQLSIVNCQLLIEIDISHLPAGVYFLKAGEEMVKIVKQ